MRNLLIFIFCLNCGIGLTQKKLLIHKVDSIDLTFRSNGATLDSVDAVNIGNINLRPAAGFAQMYEFNLAQNLYESPAGFTYLPNNKRTRVIRSSLPYLGFQYAFGSGLNQAVNVEYHHFITEDSHFHLRYHRRGSNGLMRSGEFMLNDLNLLIHHKKNRWRTAVDAYYGGYNYDENGGLVSDSLIEFFPLEFLEINKQNAQSEVRKVAIKWQNYYNIYQDSLISHGVKHQSNYELVGRKFEETPVLGAGYDQILIDSNNTRDIFQTPSISTGGGYFLSTSFLEVDGTLNHRYWRNQNLGIVRDTNEVFLHSNLWMGWEQLSLRNEFYFNTLGALGEFYNKSRVQFTPLKKIFISGGLNFDNRMPLPYQRFHFANNLKWNLDNLQTQQIININGHFSYGGKNLKGYATLNWTSINNGLFFYNNQWRQDTLDFVSVGALKFGGEIHREKWHFYPSITLRFNTDNYAYQPLFSTRNRIVYKKGLFEAEKLILALGLDLGYDIGYNHLAYNTLINVMEPGGLDAITPNLIRVNFFTAMEIDQFRFFIRAENIDYFINPQTAKIDPLFPITPFIIRLGITWDFFN